MLRSLLLVAVVGVALAYPAFELQEDASLSEHPWDEAATHRVTIVSRAQWGARAATGSSRLATPVPNVVIHHTVTGSCSNRDACSAIMRSMQNQHMNNNGWADLGYNFAVGGDGVVYEGRGWNVLGAHASGWNANSIGIALIGTFTSANPPAAQLNAARALITAGMNNGSISRTHRLMGHRQASATECPGAALYRTIQGWPNWRNAEVDFDQQLE